MKVFVQFVANRLNLNVSQQVIKNIVPVNVLLKHQKQKKNINKLV